MANNITKLNYTDLKLISKKLHAESEEYAALYSVSYHKLTSLRPDWRGRAAEAFFDELDGLLLPALHRLSEVRIGFRIDARKDYANYIRSGSGNSLLFSGFRCIGGC